MGERDALAYDAVAGFGPKIVSSGYCFWSSLRKSQRCRWVMVVTYAVDRSPPSSSEKIEAASSWSKSREDEAAIVAALMLADHWTVMVVISGNSAT
jgi:hypothetical protein